MNYSKDGIMRRECFQGYTSLEVVNLLGDCG